MKKTTFTVILDDKGKTMITLESGATIQIFEGNNNRFKLNTGEIFILTKKAQINLIAADINLIPNIEFDKIIIIDPQIYDLETAHLVQYLTETAQESGIKLAATAESITLPKNIYNACAKVSSEILTVLEPFGFKFAKKKAFSAKAQHRWKKAISEIEFHIDKDGVTGTVIWQKSTEMRLLKGAKLLPDELAPRRADGTLGFTAKFSLNLREENKNKFNAETWTTTDDITLRSVNEIGHFLYFAGTNSWLEMFDKDGRSIHELTVV